MPFAIGLARQRATVGEISDALAAKFRHTAKIQGSGNLAPAYGQVLIWI